MQESLSLGNFTHNLATTAFPVELYEQQGMPLSSSPPDLYDVMPAYEVVPHYWESAVAQFSFLGKELEAVELHPISLGFGLPRSSRGTPMLAEPDQGSQILGRLNDLSKPFGSRIDIDGTGARTVGRLHICPS